MINYIETLCKVTRRINPKTLTPNLIWLLSLASSRLVSKQIFYILINFIFEIIGYKNTIKCLRMGQSKLILIANNCPAIRKTELEYYAMLAKVPVHHYTGDNTALGTACGKFFNCSILSILDGGDSDILTEGI